MSDQLIKTLAELIQVLEPLTAEERIRSIRAVFVFLGGKLEDLATPLSPNGFSENGKLPNGDLQNDNMQSGNMQSGNMQSGNMHNGNPQEHQWMDERRLRATQIIPAQVLSAQASLWLSRNKIDPSHLHHVFTWDGYDFTALAANIPGESKRNRVKHCYLLSGVQAFLQSGELRFANVQAQQLCGESHCYDGRNHYHYVKAIGNLMSGSRSAGYELTELGLQAAANLIKEIIKGRI